MSENGNGSNVKKNGNRDTSNYKHRFGIDKPAIPGPGRPRLPDSVKERRAFLRKKLEEISADATILLNEIVNDSKAEPRDRIRAAEISLSHALPKQEEVEMNDNRPVLADWSPDILKQLAAESKGTPETNGKTGNGVST